MFEFELLQAVVARAVELQDLRDENMAIRIANQIVPPLAKILAKALR